MEKLLTTILVVVLMALGSVAGAVSIGVNMGSNEVSLASGDTAGVTVAQSNWNNASGSGGSLSNVNNNSGTATTLDVSWSANTTWHVTANGTATGDAKLMHGYIDPINPGQTAVVNLTQIPYTTYDIYVYVGSNNTGATATVTDGTTTYSFTNGANNPGGDGFQAADYVRTTDTGSGYPTANYAKFEGRTGTSKTITVTDVSSGSGIFGVQIVEVLSPVPGVATTPGPANGATSVSTTADLSWTAGAGATSHDVYFGTSYAAVAAASRLAGDIDGNGSVGIGDITVLAQQWLGTPVEPYADLDDDDDIDLADFAVVSADWLDSAGSEYKGNQSGTTYDPGTMAENTTYYWRIDEVSADGTTTGTVWHFTTVAGLVISNVSPSGYTVQYNNLAVGQLVYIDRDYAFTNVASLGGSTYIKTANNDKLATGTSFLTFNINRDSIVYVAHDDSVSTKPGWMSTFIDTGANLLHNGSVNAFSLYSRDFNVGTVTLGGNTGGSDSSSMYSVVVVPRGIQAGNPNPSNGAAGVNPDANLSWSAGAGATSRNVYFGTSSPGTFQGSQSTTTFDPAMDALTTYYWRIDEIASSVTTTGQVWSFTTSEPIVNIMPLGDSITQGGTHYRYNLWHKLEDNGYNNINFVGSHDVLVGDTYDSQVYDKDHDGHAGWRTDHVLNGGGPPEGGTGNITSWLTGLQATDELPDIVLMHLGTNDVNAGQSNSSTINEMKSVINILRNYNPNVTILVAKVIPCFIPGYPGMDGLNALIPTLDTYETPTSQVIIVDHNTGFLQSWLQADLIHPNATGATEMSNRWYAALVPIL